MSYSGISIREALEKINAPVGGWFLPQIQRQYVWGARHESETYITLLLDSLLKRYPIGGVVLWETESKIPHREFIRDYLPGNYAREVDPGRWGSHKFLVYDGQQRLQTLYSVLNFRFNDRVLHYDLLFNSNSAEADDTGFIFRDSDADHDPRFLSMTHLNRIECNDSKKIELEDRVAGAAGDDSEKKLRIRTNLSRLWSVFVDQNHKSIAYFSVRATDSREVNEVFRRLNTGGVALTQLELVLSKIKATYSGYEERLWALSDRIEKESGGIQFSSTSLLQYLYLILKHTIRIDDNSIQQSEVQKFEDQLHFEKEILVEFFSKYLNEIFSINHASIIARWTAILPILAYMSARKRAELPWKIKHLEQQNIIQVHQYFILSQFCDWNTQTMVNAFARVAISAGERGQDYPLIDIRKIAIDKNRTGDLHEYQLRNLPLLATKVILPKRFHVFQGGKPQIDHIFPRNLKDGDEAYKSKVDVLWNLQPTPAGVNNYKRARHPKEFFSSKDGQKYFDQYDFIPDPSDAIWDDYQSFLQERKMAFVDTLKKRYELSVYLQDLS